MRLGKDVINYFKGMSEESGVLYQSLINLYLRDSISQHRKIDIWCSSIVPAQKSHLHWTAKRKQSELAARFLNPGRSTDTAKHLLTGL